MPDVFRSDVEANDPEEIPAPDVDLSRAIYPSPESTEPVTGPDYDDEDDYTTDEPSLVEVLTRLEIIEADIAGLKDGVNTIGVMMNQVAEAFDQVMQKVNEGGLGALLGGIMGGKKNG